MNAHKRVRKKLEYLISLKDKVHYFYRLGLSPKKITRKLLGTEGMIKWISQNQFSKQNLVEACIKD